MLPGDLYFVTPDPSDKTEQIRRNPAVNVALESRGDCLSLASSASITKDRALVDESGNAGAEALSYDGRDAPSVTWINVRAESAGSCNPSTARRSSPW